MVKQFLEDIHSSIKSRTKEQWIDYAKSKITKARLYIQENGELGFVVAFALGIFAVVFFRLFFAIVFLAGLAAALVWCLAESEIEQREIGRSQDTPTSKISEENGHDDKSIH